MLQGLFDTKEDESGVSESSIGKGITNLKVEKPPDVRGETKFVGLDNQGATCYLNSLIQAMYMTPELRAGLLSIDPMELGIQQLDEYEREKKEEAQKGTAVDDNLLEQLKDIGMAETVARRALIEVKNAGIMEAFDYVDSHPEILSMVASTAAESNGEKEEVEVNKKKKRKPRLIPLELQRLFSQMQQLNQKTLSTEELTTKGFQWRGMDGLVQHDAHELNRLLIDALEKSLKHTSGETLCQQLYQGTLANQTKCLGCLRVSERVEHFYDLNVQVLGCDDLAASLRQHCSAEVLQGDSAYQCDHCQAKRTALRSTILRQLPKILTFSCNRFKIDRSTNWQRQKLISRCAFPLVLDMGVFAEGADGTTESIYLGEKEKLFMQNVRGGMLWSDEVCAEADRLAAELVAKHGETVSYQKLGKEERRQIAEALSYPKKVMASTAATAAAAAAGGAAAPGTITDSINNQQQHPLQHQQQQQLYELFAVIMHRGSAHSGHYFAYIRDSLCEGQWKLPDSAYEDRPVSNSHRGKDGSGGGRSAAGANIGGGGDSSRGGTYYVRNSASGEIFVDDSTPLGHVLEIILAEGTAVGGNRSSKKSLSTDKIFKSIKSNFGDTWNNLFKTYCGTLIEFLEAHEELFALEGGSNVVTKCQFPPAIVSEEEFRKQLSAEQSRHTKAAATSTPTSGTSVVAKSSTTALPVSSASASAASLLSSSEAAKSDANVVVVDEDEMLARALQEQMDFETQELLHASRDRSTSFSAAAAGGGGGGGGIGDAGDSLATEETEAWSTAGTKKKEKKPKGGISSPSGNAARQNAKTAGASAGTSISSVTSPNKGQHTTNASSSSAQAPPRSGGGGWSKGPSSTSAAASTTSFPVDEEAHRKRIAARKLANEMLNIHHGSYFEFNDSNVTPMPLKDLEKAFEGRDSAYLLVYRRVEELSDSSTTTAASAATTIAAPSMSLHAAVSVSEPDHTKVAIASAPSYWQQQIDEMNKSLSAARDEYSHKAKAVKITVLCPSHLIYDEPLLLPAPGTTEEVGEPSAQKERRTFSSGGKNYLLPAELQSSVELQVDLRMTVKEVVGSLFKVHGQFQDALGLPQLSKAVTTSFSYAGALDTKTKKPELSGQVVISTLEKYGKGFHASVPVPTDKIVGDLGLGAGKCCALLVWDGLQIGHRSVLAGMLGQPMRFTCSLLELVESPSITSQLQLLAYPMDKIEKVLPAAQPGAKTACSGSNSSSNTSSSNSSSSSSSSSRLAKVPHTRILSHEDDFWVPCSISLTEACHRAMYRLGLSPESACVHIVETSATIAAAPAAAGSSWAGAVSRDTGKKTGDDGKKISTAVTAAAPALVSHDKNFVAVQYWSGTMAKSGKAAGAKKVADDQRLVGSLGEGKEFLIETLEARGMHSMSLADAEVMRRNMLWTVSVEIDFKTMKVDTVKQQPQPKDGEKKEEEGQERDKEVVGGVDESSSLQGKQEVEEKKQKEEEKEKEEGKDKEEEEDSANEDENLIVKLQVDKDMSIYELKLRALLQAGVIKRFSISPQQTLPSEGGASGPAAIATTGAAIATTGAAITTTGAATATTAGASSAFADDEFELFNILASTRIRSGLYRGEGVIDDESHTLLEAGLRDGSFLGVERGKRLKSGTVRVRMSLVTGNDPSIKFNPRRSGERRGDAVEVEVLRSSTVTELRDLAGVMLAGLPVGWTKLEIPVPAAMQHETSSNGTSTSAAGGTAAGTTSSTGVPEKKSATAAAAAAAVPAGPAKVSFATMAKKSLATKTPSPSTATAGAATTGATATGAATATTPAEGRPPSPPRVIPRRFRRTNAFEECGEVVEEIAPRRSQGGGAGGAAAGSSGGGAKKTTTAAAHNTTSTTADATTSSAVEGDSLSSELVSVTVDDLGLQNNDLLLLEEGLLPKRGMMKFKLFLWLKDSLRLATSLSQLPPPPHPLPVPAPPSHTTSPPPAATTDIGPTAATAGDVAVAPLTAALEAPSSTTNTDVTDGSDTDIDRALAEAAMQEIVAQQLRCLLRIPIPPTPPTAVPIEPQEVGTEQMQKKDGQGQGSGDDDYLTLELHEDTPLQDLQKAVFKLLQSSVSGIQGILPSWGAPTSADHFLLRELRADNLPGRCLWSCDAPSAASSALSASMGIGMGSIGMGAGGKRPGGGGTGAGASTVPAGKVLLKKLGLQNSDSRLKPVVSGSGGNKEIGLVIEVLGDKQVKVRPPAGSFKIWLQRLSNPDNTEEGGSIMDPVWPPRSITINGGPAPSFGHLRTPISTELGVQTDKIVIFKFLPQTLEWIELRAGMKGSATATISTATVTAGKPVATIPIATTSLAAAKKQSDNILEPPYSMKEGDLLCAFAALPAASAAEAASRTYVVSRRLDKSCRKIIEAKKKERRARVKGGGGGRSSSSSIGGAGSLSNASSSSVAGSGGRKKFSQEVVLTLGGDLDFSDEDDTADSS